jgi:hypothetical protein
MTKPGRIACSVPFCRRTAPAEKYETDEMIICGRHWRLGDAQLRRLYTKAIRRKRGWLAHLVWKKVLRQAIERSAGVTG